jgi:hypothetical protein
MPRALPGHASFGDAAQLRMDERNQPLERGVFALDPGQQESRDLYDACGMAGFYSTAAQRKPFGFGDRATAFISVGNARFLSKWLWAVSFRFGPAAESQEPKA